MATTSSALDDCSTGVKGVACSMSEKAPGTLEDEDYRCELHLDRATFTASEG